MTEIKTGYQGPGDYELADQGVVVLGLSTPLEDPDVVDVVLRPASGSDTSARGPAGQEVVTEMWTVPLDRFDAHDPPFVRVADEVEDEGPMPHAAGLLAAAAGLLAAASAEVRAAQERTEEAASLLVAVPDQRSVAGLCGGLAANGAHLLTSVDILERQARSLAVKGAVSSS